MTRPSSDVYVETYHQTSGLGRHIEHDDRSLRYAAGVLPKAAIVSQHWTRRAPVFDQGQLGSCVGNAFAGWCATDTAVRQGRADFTEDTAVQTYELATQLDNVPGTYPPDDTGSTGLGGAKALVKLGEAAGYTHAFSLAALYAALQTGPACIGIDWYQSMFEPTSAHQIPVQASSGLAGGHELCVDGLDVGTSGDVAKVWVVNSWGTGWGQVGWAWFAPADLAGLLSRQGDVTVPKSLVVAPPTPDPQVVDHGPKLAADIMAALQANGYH